MAEEASFTIVFEGQAFEEGLMDVADLAPALLGLGAVVEETNKVVTRGEAQVALHVRAGFKRGSFPVDLEIAQAVYRKFIDVFAGPNATAWSQFMGLIGIGSSSFGLIQLLKRSKGKKPQSVVEIENTNKVRVSFEGESSLELEQRLWRLFNSPKARSGLHQFTKPLKREGVDRIRVRRRLGDEVVVERSDADSFNLPTEHEGELVTESERVLRLVGLTFKEGKKWRVSEGGNEYYVTILDQAFNDRMIRGEEVFRANSYLYVILRTRQWYEGTQLKAAYEVVEILKHESVDSVPPTELDLGGPTEGQ